MPFYFKNYISWIISRIKQIQSGDQVIALSLSNFKTASERTRNKFWIDSPIYALQKLWSNNYDKNYKTVITTVVIDRKHLPSC